MSRATIFTKVGRVPSRPGKDDNCSIRCRQRSVPSPIRMPGALRTAHLQRLSSRMQLRSDFLYKLSRRPAQADHDRVLIRTRCFQINELTLKQRRIHEVTAPIAESLFNEGVVAVKKHKLHMRIHTKVVAIFPFESGTGQHCVFPRCERLLDLLAQTFQPRRLRPSADGRCASSRHLLPDENHRLQENASQVRARTVFPPSFSQHRKFRRQSEPQHI